MDTVDPTSSLVRGRPSVRSRPAAPIFQALSGALGHHKVSESAAAPPLDTGEPCKIRGASADQLSAVRGIAVAVTLALPCWAIFLWAVL